ncbi:MAG: hypothetical protein ABFC34_13910 [Methanobacterium sp.]
MFYKLLNEEGDYQKIDTKERVNLTNGIEIYTPAGKVTIENPLGFYWFDSLDDAMAFFGIEKYEEIQ